MSVVAAVPVTEAVRDHGLVAARPGVRRSWRAIYRLSLVAVDVAAASAATGVGLLVGMGPEGAPATGLTSTFALALPAIWVALLALSRLYELRHLGVGTEEFRRVGRAGVVLVAAAGTTAFVTDPPPASGFVLVALPLVVLLDVIGRYTARRVLQARRRRGRAVHRAIVVGPHDALGQLIQELDRDPSHGLAVVGACYVDRDPRLHDVQVPDFGGADEVVGAVRITGADAVVVASCPQLSGVQLRQLAWRLEQSHTELLVAPGIVEVSRPRLTVQPLGGGLPLLHVDAPTFAGVRRVLKDVLDRAVALAALIVLLPALVALAVLIRRDGGRCLYRQTRVGWHGRTFTMLKLRTMREGAESVRDELLDRAEPGHGPLFKLRDDPRVTAVGGVLRRYSLDELPQLVNVVRGEMSLVGPRPPLPDEVAQYSADVHRRFLVKPGLTGLWQVSGRAELSWEDTVRLDLRYVDNWSLALDLRILWRTVRAVLNGAGAY